MEGRASSDRQANTALSEQEERVKVLGERVARLMKEADAVERINALWKLRWMAAGGAAVLTLLGLSLATWVSDAQADSAAAVTAVNSARAEALREIRDAGENRARAVAAAQSGEVLSVVEAAGYFRAGNVRVAADTSDVGHFLTASAPCPSGRFALGGGALTTAETGVYLHTSAPVLDRDGRPVGWRAGSRPDQGRTTDSPHQLVAFAVCS